VDTGSVGGHHPPLLNDRKESHNRGTIADLIISLLTVCLAALLIKGKTNKTSLANVDNVPRARFEYSTRPLTFAAALAGLAFSASPVFAQSEGGEANLRLPDLSDVTFFAALTATDY